MDRKVDPEMLKNLDLLLNMDVVESETDWQAIAHMDDAKKSVPTTDTSTAKVEGVSK